MSLDLGFWVVGLKGEDMKELSVLNLGVARRAEGGGFPGL